MSFCNHLSRISLGRSVLSSPGTGMTPHQHFIRSQCQRLETNALASVWPHRTSGVLSAHTGLMGTSVTVNTFSFNLFSLSYLPAMPTPLYVYTLLVPIFLPPFLPSVGVILVLICKSKTHTSPCSQDD